MTQTPGDLSDSQSDMLWAYANQGSGEARVNDEMMAPDGTVKPVWKPFIDHLGRLSPEELTKRFARGDRYLQDAGVLYRQYDESLSTEREWPLSHVPVFLDEAEWTSISAGLIERADLLEHIVQDFYGANELVASRQLPATLLSQNPAWLRPLVGQGAPGTNYLNFLSFEIGRGPDGKWWVISDLIEAPSTAGFAIENRIAMSRVFPNFFKGANVHRLAGFFRSFQQNLFNLKGRADGAIALLSPGPMNQHYAEHAYIARYLGLLLVEGEDLIVSNGKAMVRTVAGLKPLSLLWNRVPSAMCDPLELDASSMLGTPGLLEALRARSLKTVNALGAGVLETRALMAFFPKIARGRLGRDLSMPNIATWWCGQDSQRDHVLAHRDSMMVGSAFSTTPLMADLGTTVLGSDFDGPGAQRMQELLRDAGRDLVGQEAVTLSTTPAFENGTLVARPMCVRVFLCRNGNGWDVMPGGYARISAGEDAKALTMQRGGKVADVWVVSDTSVNKHTLLSDSVKISASRLADPTLPSRAADNLFWLGRYVERAEHFMRLFRAYHARISDGASHEDPSLTYVRALLMNDADPDANAMAETFNAPLKLGLQSASRISDRFSPDGMMAMRALVANSQELDSRVIQPDEIAIEISALLRQVTGFAGLVHENMYRTDGWRFLSLGLSLERSANMCAILSALTAPKAPDGALDLALEIGDSVGAYRTRFSIWAHGPSVTDLLCLDTQNPRSVRYHVSRAKNHIDDLPKTGPRHILSDAARRALMVETRLAASTASEITPDGLMKLREDIWNISTALSEGHLV
ncbi:circularly permuted type 2 ATP-grasp protein [Tropicimonas sp. S265A]|uniref:circularly permuted type 2 ATP-grasp protein n=1 Tax=Tropicimonas sp. S265A TaxID=3415134 RepID=UPI003C7E0F0D